jgi:radical SAM family uncharacterized protein/radical SAM-linked protein
VTKSQGIPPSLKQRIFSDLLPFVAKPGRYIGNEFNMIRKDPAAAEVRVALVFPDVYEVGMSYLGYPILYHILNQQPHIYAERAFAPWLDMAAQMREKGVPLFTLETFSPLRDFDLVGFTLQYELNYTTILDLIDLAGLPLLAAERQKGPLIVGGGPSVFNPEPVADFFDLLVIGDGEEAVLELAEAVGKARKEGQPRGELLRRCAQIPGVYVPQFYRPHLSDTGSFAGLESLQPEVPQRIRARIVPELARVNYSHRPLVPVIATTHDRVSLEIARGCSRGCRFCNAGMIYRPVRQRSVDDLVEQAVESIRATGYDEVSLVSLSTSDYEELGPLMRCLQVELGRKMVNLSFPSLRPEKFTPEVARFAKGVRKSGLTLAPEAGTQRLREVINKTTTAEDLLRAVDLAFREGWKVVKLYFMIGQPTETDEDLQGMADLIGQVVALARRRSGARINVSVSPFVPKAGTPFQWAPQDDPAETRRKLAFLRDRIRDKLVKISWRDAEVAQIEGVLARGDRRLGKVILRAWQAGARLEGWSENFDPVIWLQALAAEGLQPEQFTEGYPLEAALPWAHLDKGVTIKFLQDEYRRALGQEVTPDCRDGKCNRCGLMGQPVCQEILKGGNQLRTGGQRVAPVPESGETHPAPSQGPPGPGEAAQAADSGLQAPVPPREGRWVRLHYHRGEEVRWISHLDFIHVLERALRRAEWPLVYSEGFNPHPRISYAPPLPTGHISQAEYIDLMAAGEEIAPRIAALQAQLPAGIVIREAVILPAKPRALADEIVRAEHRVTWPTLAVPANIAARIERLMAQNEAWVTRQKANEPSRRLDIRPFLIGMAWREDSLQIVSHIDHGKTVRMEEIISLLFPDEPGRARLAAIERMHLWMERGGDVVSPLTAVEGGTRV